MKAAGSHSWDLSGDTGYTYGHSGDDSNKIEFSDNKTQLKLSKTPGTNWINTDNDHDWTYRKAITITNPTENELTNYQVKVNSGVSTQELVASWPLNETEGTTINDTSGNGHNGISYNASIIDGKFGKALSFDGENGYATLGDNLRFTSGDFTMSFWLKLNGTYGGTDCKPIARGSPDEPGDMVWAINTGNNHLGVTFRKADNSNWNFGWAPSSFETSNALENDTWYQVAVTRSGNNYTLYFNGNQDVTTTNSDDISDTANDHQLSLAAFGGERFHGAIDDLNIFTRALSGDEITSLYNNSGGDLSNVLQHANSDGSDIRFTDSNKTTALDYWLESFDPESSEATMWVKIPSIPAESSKTIYIYYGNSDATDDQTVDEETLEQVVTLDIGGEKEGEYSTDKPYIISPNYSATGEDPPGLAWKTFSATVSDADNVKFQFSNDDGTTWQWWDGDSWESATEGDWNAANQAGDITSTVFSAFADNNNTYQIKWLGILNSDGIEQTYISNVSVTYKTDIVAPDNPSEISAYGFITDNTYNTEDQPKVSFEKSNYGGEVDSISDTVSITRGEEESIYNSISEGGYTKRAPFDRNVSPQDTEWNANGWSDLSDVSSRSYVPFAYAAGGGWGGGIGDYVVGKELVMHAVTENRYFKIQFSSWTCCGQGGGFAYTRQEISSSGENIGLSISFGKTDYGNQVDIISNYVHISRDNDEGIYNRVTESASPTNTEWNADGWDDLSNITTRTYQGFVVTLNDQVGDNVLNKELIMHIISEDRYFKVKFSKWTSRGQGGGFAYERQEIAKEDISVDSGVNHWYPIKGGAITWNEPDDPGTGASGLKGYYLYRSTSLGVPEGTPISNGDLTEISDGENSGVHFQQPEDTELSELPTSNGTYYYYIQTVDNEGNYSTPTLIYTLNVDNTSYNAPTDLFPNPSGWSKSKDFSFAWSQSTAGDSQSGLLGYQYRLGWATGTNNITTKPWLPENVPLITGEESTVTHELSADEQDTLTADHSVYLFEVRAINNAGLSSGYAQCNFFYRSGFLNPPTAREDSVTQYNDANDFIFKWNKPVQNPGDAPIIKYYYNIGSFSDDDIANYKYTVLLQTPRGPYATKQGENHIYIKAQDSGLNLSGESLDLAFYVSTNGPGYPTGVEAVDGSNRVTKKYKVFLTWLEPEDKGTGFDGYNIYRSDDGLVWDWDHPIGANSGENASTSYADSGLQSKKYYYCIKAKDNAGQLSVASAIVSITPTGRYTTPPKLIEGTTDVKVKVYSARITWDTEREADSYIDYGTSDSHIGVANGGKTATGSRNYVTRHEVNLTGLDPSTNYSYRLIWRDSDGNEGTSETYYFTTGPRPKIYEISESHITLNSAIVSFKTDSAASMEIDFGPTLNYGGKAIDSGGSYITTHSVILNGLNDSTLYHYTIQGTDVDGNPINIGGADRAFSTLTMPKILGAVKVDQNKDAPTTTYRFNWMTNVETTTVIYYHLTGGQTLSKSLPEYTTTHSLEIPNLADMSTYSFEVTGVDKNGIMIDKPFTQDINTPKDTRPPKISNLTIEVKSSGFGATQQAQIVVSWETDEPSTSQVEYAQGISGTEYNNKSKVDLAYSNTHVVIVSELEPSKIYHLRALSADASGNVGRSDDTTVITGKMQSSVLDIIINSLQKSLGWLFGIFQ